MGTPGAGRWGKCAAVHIVGARAGGLPWLSWLLVAVLLGGCSQEIRVHKVRQDAISRASRLNALSLQQVSPRSQQVLRQFGLERNYPHRVGDVFRTLDEAARAEGQREILFALAELAHLEARKAEMLSRPKAMSLYSASTAYAFDYLFDPTITPEINAYDPQFRLACDLYNRSLARMLRLSQSQEFKLSDSLRLETACGRIEVEVARRGSLWNLDHFDYFLLAQDYEVEGLRNHYVTYGLGVPLVAVSRPDRPEVGLERLHPPKQTYAVTAVLRMVDGERTAEGHIRRAVLDLYDPMETREIKLAGRIVPLESDLTTPLAIYLARSKLRKLAYVGLLRGDRVLDEAGLRLPRPYEPGKIPVVMVHGLWSSPQVWMQMYNDLAADPKMRDRFQFWFFFYPTGSPMLFSAKLLREALEKARNELDPEGLDPALDQMVLVGHSMGGLLAKTTTQASGDAYWNLLSERPISELQGPEEEVRQVKEALFFEPLPYVRRVVFLATPHRGSRLGAGPVGRITSTLIQIPSRLNRARAELLANNPGLFRPGIAERLPTSVDNLATDSPILQTMASLPLAEQVTYHSIIGDISAPSRPRTEGTDGVVPYRSAHLGGVASELIIEANHSGVPRHPLAVREVRRILLEHYRASQSERGTVIHASATTRVEQDGSVQSGQATNDDQDNEPSEPDRRDELLRTIPTSPGEDAGT